MFGNSKLKLIPRRSYISGKIPKKLDHLELCLNLADGLVWIGDSEGMPILIKELTNSSEIFSGSILKNG
jgi:hypothetical protein